LRGVTREKREGGNWKSWEKARTAILRSLGINIKIGKSNYRYYG